MTLVAESDLRSESAERRAVLGVTRSATARPWRDRLDARGGALARQIAQEAGLPDVVSRLLAARDVAADAAEAYLNPQLKTLLPDPSLFTDMDAAAARLADAVERGEKLAVFGDYDVDGATSVAVLVRYLRGQGLDPAVYIPDRLVDGYGPNPRAVGELAAGGATLLVTLDCGTSSFEAFDEAKRRGLDVVTLDHHQAGVELPPTLALVNPNRQDDLSGHGHLAAVGVTFVALVAINRELRRRGWFERRGTPPPDLLSLLDLVALGTVCDVVPLKGLNRAFVVKGLTVLRARGNRGLAALADVVRLSGPPTPYSLAFMLGPRINAGGRIGDSGLGARLLTSDDAVDAGRIAVELDRLNRERQALEAEAVDAAELMVAARLGGEAPPVIVEASEDWHPGIVGLVAARLKERYRCPTFAIALDRDGGAVGSGRSIAGVDLGAVVRLARERGLIAKGGGHAMAAGVSLPAAGVDAFRAFVAAAVADGVAMARAAEALEIDAALTADGATPDLVEAIGRVGPFGSAQPEPLFVFPSHRLLYLDAVGRNHLRLTLCSSAGTKLKAMAFRAVGQPLGDFLAGSRGAPLHVAGHVDLDWWQGAPRVQIRVVDAADPAKSRF
ncbi:single-stranded-DNA-specific exonuclease RecJ [Pleomorphomonas koreensis]|uniref:single-stranded-DNA-specific exonuclease RecJ n=1 Tax=Pleomorphomonas koreensis TaxID=257440 RepID=UPI00041844E7|nr:single-stranded-DNA-specific exonuclease RecJ [Pleomorphomonas koreensis]